MADGIPEDQLDRICDMLEDMEMTAIPLEELEAALVSGLQSAAYLKVHVTLLRSIVKSSAMDIAISEGDEGDTDSFLIELSSVLRILECPFPEFQDNCFEAIQQLTARVNLAEWLCCEAQTLRMFHSKHGTTAIATHPTASQTHSSSLSSSSHHTSTQDLLSQILSVLGLTNEAHLPADRLFPAIASRITEVAAKVGPDYIEPPLLQDVQFSPEQWDELERINEALAKEYGLRKQMLLKRIDVTLQSFKWSDKGKASLDKLEKHTQPQRQQLSFATDIQAHDILFTQRDILNITKTSGVSVAHQRIKKIHGVLIGRVPDRGGRPSEKRAPTTMPSFRKRTVTTQPQRDQGRRGSGGGRGRGRSKNSGGNNRRKNKVQGGWNK